MKTYFGKKSFGGHRIVTRHKNGSYMRMMNLKAEGLGISEKMYGKDLGRDGHKNLTHHHDYLTIKQPRAKKYISLDL